jgi:transposase InsO family protein
MTAAIVIKRVKEIREDLPRAGVNKLHYMLAEELQAHQIKMGRDALRNLLWQHGYLVHSRRRRPYTTNALHPYRKYPNLIRDMEINKAGQLWVSDITYIKLTQSFCYLSIVTDAYSRKIIGYQLHSNLKATGAVNALIKALQSTKTEQLIHHSDRGIQYCCSEYVDILEHAGINISMTEKGDPYENAIAERVNGILKTEFFLNQTFASFNEAKAAVDNTVEKYNRKRPHASCDYLTPSMAHEQQGILTKRWKKKTFYNPFNQNT